MQDELQKAEKQNRLGVPNGFLLNYYYNYPMSMSIRVGSTYRRQDVINNHNWSIDALSGVINTPIVRWSILSCRHIAARRLMLWKMPYHYRMLNHSVY